MLPVKETVFVITGVSRGLGLALAQGLLHLGHTVVGCSRAEKDLARVRKSLEGDADLTALDVADAEQVHGWAKAVLKKFRKVDWVINNAAVINRNARLWEVPGEEFSRVIDINIKGVANMIRSFVPSMVERNQGMIVNFSSGWGRSVDAEVAPYCATKWAVEGLTKALALELPPGMGAVALNPGVINTEMLQSCFGEGAAAYATPPAWAKRAIPYILKLTPRENGQSLTVA